MGGTFWGPLPHIERACEGMTRRQAVPRLGLEKIAGKEAKALKKKLWPFVGGIAVGLLNGLLGAGGGMVTVPLLEWLGVTGKRSHATSLSVIVPLSLVSAGLYWYRGWFSPAQALPYLPWGLAGAFLGALLLPRLKLGWVKVLFAALLLWAGWRLLW